NSQSSNIYQLNGLGGGFFNDSSPRIVPTARDPGPIIPLPLPGAPSGVITINAGSDRLSYFPDLAHSNQRTDISSVGNRPVAAGVADVNGDGFSDLVVANNGDGVVSLLLGGSSGLTLADRLTNPNLPHPSGLALVLGGNAIKIYGTAEGQETAVLLF